MQGCSGKFLIWGNGFRDLGRSNGGACALRTALFEIFAAKSRVWGQFGPENKLIEGQPNECDVICRNASVSALHLWPTIFAGAPFRLQNICRNGVPPRSRTTTPLVVVLVTFCNHNFVNCKATLKIYGIKYNISLNDLHT